MSKRGYTKQRRAQQEAETHQRIVDAAIELHGSVGPRDTTISAIAQHAGVQRLTVYRHFPDADTLFRACTSDWLARHPPPDPAAQAGIADPGQRMRALLGALYAYYRGTAPMWRLVYRDLDDVPALQGPIRGFEQYLETVRTALMDCCTGGSSGPGRRLAAVLAHAVTFGCWKSLAAGGVGDPEIAELVAIWVQAVDR